MLVNFSVFFVLLGVVTAIPQAPKNLVIQSTSITSFIIKWDPPDDTQTGDQYVIVNKQGESLTYIPEECPNVIPTTDTQTQSETSYSYLLAKPFYNYDVSVSVLRDGEEGESAQIQVQTTATQSEILDSFSYSNKTVINNGTVDLHGTLTWNYPCQPNGRIVSFLITLSGNYTEDDTIIFNPQDLIVPKNDTYEQTYDLSSYLEYSYIYTAVIRTKNTAGTGEPNTVDFKTDPNFPSQPANLATTDDGQKMQITWDETSGNIGKITYFIDITEIGPGDGDKDCNDPNTSPIHSETEETSFTIDINAYYKYEISVTGSTKVGESDSAQLTNTTNPYLPEKVENLNYQLTSSNDSSEYKAQITGTFEEPCRFNGLFKEYQVKCKGQRNNFKDHEYEQNILKDDPKTFGFDLRPQYGYSCSVRAITEEYEGAEEVFTCEAPAGVPILNNTEPLEEPTLKSYNEVKFLVRKNYFLEDNGDNIYWAVILSDEDTQNSDNFEYWDGNWPELVGNRSYVTPEKWQPFQDGILSEEITVSGLNETTEYFLMVRAFTTIAFRDSGLVKIKTGSKPADDDDDGDDGKKTNWGMIGGIIGGVVGALLIVAILVVYWRRRKSKQSPKLN